MAEPVLLTGATGFVGRAVLAELVTRGIPVHAVSRRPRPPQPGVVWHEADLLAADGRERLIAACPARRLVHCAWDVEHGVFWTSPANALWHEASLDLARRLMARSGKRIFALGTCAEYDALAAGPWNETRPVAPATPYGQAKASLHIALSELCGDALTWARLFHLYGPGEDRRRLIPALTDALRAGRTFRVRSSGLLRDMASTAHVARCLVGLLEAGAKGDFDVGSGQPRTLGALARIVALALGLPGLPRLSHDPDPGDPPRMAPELRRLFGTISIDAEMPEDALRRHTLREDHGV
jgi:nucleoside-diphosphate-sugar epimerase